MTSPSQDPRDGRGVPARKRYVLAACSSGLGNRLTVWAGAQRIADRTSRELMLYWPKNEQAGCDFDDLFANDCSTVGPQDIHYLLGTSVTMKVYNTWRTHGPLGAEVSPDGDPDVEILLLKAWYYPKFMDETYDAAFFDSVAAYLRRLQPRAELQERAEAFELPPRCVGIHVRRDGSCSEFDRSKEVHFQAIMEGLVDRDPEIGFFVASNEPEVEERFQQRFGDRVRRRPKQGAGRHCIPGMEDALVDLLILSRTRAIVGTYYSSYSHVAAALGRLPHVTADADSSKGNQKATLDCLLSGLGVPAAIRPGSAS